jgi:hypothetical protein
VGRQVLKPVTPQEKASATHGREGREGCGDGDRWIRDETVAAKVTTGLLRCPDVAFKAMPDDHPDCRLAG